MSSAYFTLIIFRNSDHSTNPLPRSVTDVPPVCGPLGGVREERKGVNPFAPRGIMSEQNNNNAHADIDSKISRKKNQSR